MDNNQNNNQEQSNSYYQQPYQQPTYSQQAYGQPSYDNGEPQQNGISLAAMICGIAGFVTGYGVSIAALVLSSIYKKNHNGRHCKQSKTGFTCGLISLILWVLFIIVYCIVVCAAAMLANS